MLALRWHDWEGDIWDSPGTREPGAILTVKDDGDVVLAKNGHVIWSTGTGGLPNCGTLLPNAYLSTGEMLRSCDGRFVLAMQGDGNLVLYFNNRALWASNTAGRPAVGVGMGIKGDLVIYGDRGTFIWDTGTFDNPGAALSLQNDGNVVIYKNGRALWATNTGGH
jgi:hypothetical protein